jgi:uncharacterized protein (TIRG00374 family)
LPSPHPSDTARRGPAPWLWLIGAAIAVGLLWWALRDVSLVEVLGHLASARPIPLLAAVAVATLGFLLRALRWQEMLAPGGERPRFAPMWHAVAIGFMANHLLPARAGEFARAFVGARLTGLKFSTTLGSLVLERALDGVAVLGLTLVPLLTLTTAEIDGRDLAPVLRLLAAVFAAVLTVALLLALAPNAAGRLVHRVLRVVLPAKWAHRIDGIVDGALRGVSVLRHPGPAIKVLGWTLVFWTVNAFSFYFAFAAFGLTLPFQAALLVQGLIVVGIALPSVPGYFGPFEAATKAALVLSGVEPTRAVAYAVGYHIATLIPITLLGLWSLRHAAHLRLRQLTHVEEPTRDDDGPSSGSEQSPEDGP